MALKILFFVNFFNNMRQSNLIKRQTNYKLKQRVLQSGGCLWDLIYGRSPSVHMDNAQVEDDVLL